MRKFADQHISESLNNFLKLSLGSFSYDQPVGNNDPLKMKKLRSLPVSLKKYKNIKILNYTWLQNMGNGVLFRITYWFCLIFGYLGCKKCCKFNKKSLSSKMRKHTYACACKAVAILATIWHKSFWKDFCLNENRYLRYNYNHGHNILIIFDVLPIFPFTTSETKPDY